MHRIRKVEKSCVTFLLCDHGWCVHKSDVQNKWDDNKHTHTAKRIPCVFIMNTGVMESSTVSSLTGGRRLSLTLHLFCFALLRFSSLSLRPQPFVQPSFDMQAAPIAIACFCFFLLFIWRCRFFRVFFVPFPLSLCMESIRFSLPNGVFLPCDHGLDF